LEGDGKKPMIAPVKQSNRLFAENQESDSSKTTKSGNEIVYVKKWM